MQSTASRALGALGFSVLFALTAACGGSKPEAKAPSAETIETPRVGSSAPDLLPPDKGQTATPPKTSAVSSTDDGSDIIPPFSSAKDSSKKASGPAKVQKKAAAKPKKKT